MIYKIYEGLSDYLIAPDGTAIHKSTGEAIPFQRTPLVAGYTAKLITDETFTFLKGKRKPIKLVRRFTREQLVKMYGQSKNMFNDLGSEVPFTQKVKDIAKETNLEPEDVINARLNVGVQIHEAILDGKEAIDPVAKQIASEFLSEAGQVSKQQLDQLSGAKPKVITRGGKKQVRTTEVKAGTTTVKTTPVTMKIPFLKIDGVDYQSARQASKALGVAVNTVLKRAKANKDGWFYIEK